MDFFYTQITDKAIELVTATLRSTFLSEGKSVQEFEQAIAKELGLINPVAVNSGTSALHLALVLAGVGPGDEVILAPQTFVATGLVILMQGATPVFADIQYETGNICPCSLRTKLTNRSRAIMAVHWGGYPCDLDEIEVIAKEHRIIVIEDAAHALGATYKGKPIGSISQFTAFSFQAIKHLTTGDGGALCCLRAEDFAEARNRRWFGIDRAGSTPSILGERQYDILSLGFKYHMNDLAAAVGLGNLEAFSGNLERVRKIGHLYRTALDNTPGLRLLQYREDRESAFWLFTVLVENRLEFIRKLRSHGVPTSVVHLRIDQNSIFGGLTDDLENQAKFNEEQVALPIHCGLSDDDVERVIRSVKSGW